jgi:hypothetical protein
MTEPTSSGPKKKITVRSKGQAPAKSTAVPGDSPSAGPKVYAGNVSRQGFVDNNLANFWWALALACGSLLLAVLVLFWTPDHYNIPSTDDYRLITLTALSEQGDIADDDARDFVSKALVRTLSLSHLQPKANMNRALDENFTASGRKDFVRALSANDDLDPLLSGRYATIAELLTVPIIEGYRLTDGRFTWVYKVPVRWRWNDVQLGETTFADISVTVFVVRESQLVKSNGMAIDAVIIGGS